MTKLMCLGFAMFCIGSLASLTMTPPAAVAWDEARHETANARPSRVIELPTISIVGRIDQKCVEVVETFHSHEEYDVGTTHIIADGEAFIYASR